MNTIRAVDPSDRPPFVETWFDIRNQTEGNLEHLVMSSLSRIIDLSRQAVEQIAYSYRGFRVGCAVLALDEPGKRMGIYFGGNFTPYKGAEWNCAEKRALPTVEARGFNKILAIAVSGPQQIDESGVKSPTLHPCHKCRNMLKHSHLTDPNTLITTVTPEGSAHEIHSLESLLKLHETGQEQPFPSYPPLLPIYWNEILTYDHQVDVEDMQRLALIARMANPPLK